MNLKETYFLFPSYISLEISKSSFAGAAPKSIFLNEVMGINSIYLFKYFSSKLKTFFIQKNGIQSKTESVNINKKASQKKEENKIKDDQPKYENEDIKKDEAKEDQEGILKKEDLASKEEIILTLKGLMHEKIVGVADEIKGSIKGIFQSLGEKNEEIKKEVKIQNFMLLI